MERNPDESFEEFLERREKYFFPLIQVTSMVVFIQVKLEDCAKALQNEYGLEWNEEWDHVFNSLQKIQLKIENFHKEITDQE